MKYSSGSHYRPADNIGAGSLDIHADEIIASVKEYGPQRAFNQAMIVVKTKGFNSLFEYRITACIKRKLRIR